METVSNLFNKEYSLTEENEKIYQDIHQKLLDAKIEPMELRQYGFIPIDPNPKNEFFNSLTNMLPGKTCFLRLRESKPENPSDQTLTLVYRLTSNGVIHRTPLQATSKDAWSCGIPIVNCVVNAEDFLDNKSLSKKEQEELEKKQELFKKYLNEGPNLILDYLREQTQMKIDEVNFLVASSANVSKITNSIFLCQIETPFENIFGHKKPTRTDPDYFLVSSNQISQILKFAKESKNKPAEIELHEVSENPKLSPEVESQITQLHKLISEKNQQAILNFIPKCTKNVLNAPNHRGTALHRAAAMGNTAIVDALIKRGAIISQKNENGQIPLHFAIMNRHYEKKLLELLAGPKKSFFSSVRACVNIVDTRGHTALYYAITAGNSHAIEILHNFGAIAQITFPNAEISDPYLIAAAAKIKKPGQFKAVLEELAKYYPSTDKDIAKKCQQAIASRTDIDETNKKVFLNILAKVDLKIVDNNETKQTGLVI